MIMLYDVGIYNSKVHLQSIGRRTAQMIAKGESVSNSRAKEIFRVGGSETKHTQGPGSSAVMTAQC